MASTENADLAARRRNIAMALIDGYNAWDIEKIMEPRAADCTHQLLPASLKRPQLSYQAFKDFFGGMIPQFRNVKFTVQDIFDDAAENKVAISCLTTGDTDIGPYNNELIFLIYLNKECTHIVKILEFVDSAFTADFFPRLRAHMEQTE
ncbi:hypothetical protein V8F20_011790 [Naviculisporaceae sp. PSN 640]